MQQRVDTHYQLLMKTGFSGYMFFYGSFLLTFLLCVTFQASAYEPSSITYVMPTQVKQVKPVIRNYCITKSPERSIKLLCQNDSIHLPIEKTRNINTHQFIAHNSEVTLNRKPQIFDYLVWKDTLNGPEGVSQAHVLKQALAIIKGRGELTYDIYEFWRWQRCQLTTDVACGGYYYCKKDPSGQKTDGDFYYEGYLNAEQKSAFLCEYNIKACHLDKTIEESLFCSREIMTYDYTFIRPTDSEWNISSKGYHPYLANKYDLLPGEVEEFVVVTGGDGNSTISEKRLKPRLFFNEAYNDYKIKYTGNAYLDTLLEQGTDKHLSIDIHTIKRKVTRSPNPLTAAKTWDGHDIDPIQWQGEFSGDNYVEKAVPNALLLQDSSAESIRYFSEQSVSQVHKKEQFVTKTPFLKNTKIKVTLYEKGSFWRLWKRKKIGHLYVSDTDVIQASLNALSDSQDIQLSDHWKIPLDNEGHEKSIYINEQPWLFKIFSSNPFRRHLKPSTEYTLEVSVYQEGFNFYTQANDKATGNFFYRMYKRLTSPSEDTYYSKPIHINFTTSKDIDNRVFWEKVEDPVYFTLATAAVSSALVAGLFILSNYVK